MLHVSISKFDHDNLKSFLRDKEMSIEAYTELLWLSG